MLWFTTPIVESERLGSHLAEYFFEPQCFHLHDGEYDGVYTSWGFVKVNKITMGRT